MNPSQKSRKPPPVPSFQQSSIPPKPLLTPPPYQPPIQPKQPQIPDKKKPNLNSINQKLANMMKNKKDLIEKKKIQNNINKTVEEKKNAEEELYHPAFPNHYEEIKHLYDFGVRESQSQINHQMVVEEQQKKSKEETSGGINKQGLIVQRQEEQIVVELSEAEEMALKIMQKCGFKVGEGLGKNSQGITTPIVIKKTTDATCVVIQSTVPMDQIIKPQTSARIALQTLSISPSNIIVLPNITTLSQLNEDIQTEIRTECQKYGNVIGWISFLINNELRIFVEYENKSEAFQTFVYLNQRYYDDRLISVRFYNPSHFKDQNYSQDLHAHVSF